MWEAIIWVVVTTFIGIGCMFVSITPSEFIFARICFISAAIVATVRITWYMLLEPASRPQKRKILGLVATYIVISPILWMSLSWIDKREQMIIIGTKLQDVREEDRIAKTIEDLIVKIKSKIGLQSALAPKTEIKLPPDLSNTRQTLIAALNQFPLGSPLKDVSNVVPGYFELFGGPAPGTPYSNPSVTTKETFSTHFYASVRMAALENVQTMDFFGRDIAVCIDPSWTAYLIWETEQSQTVWKPILVERNPILNTLAIYQKGKNVDIFINNNYVDSFTKLRSPQPGPIGIYLKANATKGGKMFFRDFSIWDFGI